MLRENSQSEIARKEQIYRKKNYRKELQKRSTEKRVHGERVHGEKFLTRKFLKENPSKKIQGAHRPDPEQTQNRGQSKALGRNYWKETIGEKLSANPD
jgi:hypothetical protein